LIVHDKRDKMWREREMILVKDNNR
jgi:hypothetical protein